MQLKTFPLDEKKYKYIRDIAISEQNMATNRVNKISSKADRG